MNKASSLQTFQATYIAALPLLPIFVAVFPSSDLVANLAKIMSTILEKRGQGL